MRRLSVVPSLILLMVTVFGPSAAFAGEWKLYEYANKFANKLPQLMAVKDENRVINPDALRRPLRIENAGMYPIISLKVDGQELLSPNQHLRVGNYLDEPVSILTSHTVDIVFGTPSSNYYGISFAPLWERTYPQAQAGTTVRVEDWTATDALTTGGGMWFGQYLDSNNNWVDSLLVFYGNGTFEWYLNSTFIVAGTYQQGAVNTYGIFREVNVTTTTGEQDTFFLLDYERAVNVWIVDGFGRWVPHVQ